MYVYWQNAIRHYDIGVPLTIGQYRRLEAEVLVDRLINRHRKCLLPLLRQAK